MKQDCVCYSEEDKRCVAIKLSAIDRGHTCDGCAFYKSHETYIKETGKTYAEKVEEDIELYSLEHGGI